MYAYDGNIKILNKTIKYFENFKFIEHSKIMWKRIKINKTLKALVNTTTGKIFANFNLDEENIDKTYKDFPKSFDARPFSTEAKRRMSITFPRKLDNSILKRRIVKLENWLDE